MLSWTGLTMLAWTGLAMLAWTRLAMLAWTELAMLAWIGLLSPGVLFLCEYSVVFNQPARCVNTHISDE